MRCLSMLCEGNLTPTTAVVYEMLKSKQINENLFYNEVVNQNASKKDSMINGILSLTFLSTIDSWARNNSTEFLFPRKLLDYAHNRGTNILIIGENNKQYSFDDIYKEIQSIKQKYDSGVDKRNPFSLLGEYYLRMEDNTNIKVYRSVLLNLLTTMSIYAIKSTAYNNNYYKCIVKNINIR